MILNKIQFYNTNSKFLFFFNRKTVDKRQLLRDRYKYFYVHSSSISNIKPVSIYLQKLSLANSSKFLLKIKMSFLAFVVDAGKVIKNLNTNKIFETKFRLLLEYASKATSVGRSDTYLSDYFISQRFYSVDSEIYSKIQKSLDKSKSLCL